jgi:F0F1-type ATP synthase membrane subunit a
MAKIPENAIGWIVGLVALLIVLVYKPNWRAMILAVIGSGMVAYSVTNSIKLSLAAAAIVLLVIFVATSMKEGFEVNLGLDAAPKEIADLMKKVKNSTY